MRSDAGTAAATPVPGRFALAKWPAVITLAVTAARLLAELDHAPDWLANSAAGGFGAVLGIAWLPMFFGPRFAARISPSLASPGARTWRLATTLAIYGWLARVPVLALFFLDRKYGWHTHYGALPPEAPKEFWKQALMVSGAQLVFWPLVWTVIVGTATGAIVFALRKPRPAPAPA